MTKTGLIWTVIVWVAITIYSYYYVNWFILAFLWFGLSLLFLILTVIQIIKTIKERTHLTSLRIAKLAAFAVLLFLTVDGRKVNLAIEKVDWLILQSKRNKIVEQVKNEELKPNVSWNGSICELPFSFPVVSNGGNDISISKNEGSKTTTVTFWVFRNFHGSPSTQFIYTDDLETISEIEKKIAAAPEYNWKIKDNWYRTYGELEEDY